MLLYSDRLQTGIGDLGVLLSVSNSQLISKTNTLHVDRYYPRTDLVSGETVYAPGGIGWRELTLDRERTGANAALQWRSPEHTVDAVVEYFYAHATFDQDENAIWNIPGATLNGTGLSFSNGFLTGGVMDDGGWQGSSRYNKREANNDDLSLHVNWFPAARLHLETDIQHVRANTKIIDLTMGPVLNGSPGSYGLQLHGADEPSITVPNNGILTDPNSVVTGWAMDHHEHSNADAWAYRADADYTFDDSDWLEKVRFGVRYEDYKSTIRETGYRWGSVGPTWGGGPATFSTYQSTVPYIVQPYSNWFHGGSAPSGFLFQAPGLFRNYDAWANSILALYAAGAQPGCCTWTKWTATIPPLFRPTMGWVSTRRSKRPTRLTRNCRSNTGSLMGTWACVSCTPRRRAPVCWCSSRSRLRGWFRQILPRFPMVHRCRPPMATATRMRCPASICATRRPKLST